MSVPDIVIITGLSGSGMSSATNAFQDLGYFCVDNLPITMLPTFRLVTDDEEKGIRRAALVIDIREGGFLADFEKQLEALRALGLKVTVLFFEASDDVLQYRFSETRRPHPAEKVRDCSLRSRRTRGDVEDPSLADQIIDTSNTPFTRCAAFASSGSVRSQRRADARPGDELRPQVWQPGRLGVIV